MQVNVCVFEKWAVVKNYEDSLENVLTQNDIIISAAQMEALMQSKGAPPGFKGVWLTTNTIIKLL